MSMIRRLAAAAAAFLLLSTVAIAGSSPNMTYGQVLTAGQWNALFAGKQDDLGFVPVNRAGDTMFGRLGLIASTTATAGVNCGVGTAPSTPVDGDIWCTTGGLFVRVSGTTIGPLIGASGSNFAGTTPIVINASAGLVTVSCPTCGVTGSPLSQFAATTSAQMAGIISDETGSGSAVFATSPVLVTPNLGTPSAATLTNATGLPIAGIAGLAAGMGTFLATPTSANLAATVTDETGSGPLVFATSPTMTTPNLGVASATSINKVAITAPATSATITIANGKTATVNNTLTLAGIDATTLTFQGTDTYVGRATTDTLTNKTFDTASTGNVLKVNGTQISAVTGTGAAVLATSPTLVTPALGAATATTINNVGISGSGFSLALGGSLTTAGALTQAGAFPTTLTSTAATNSTLPAGTHTLAGLDVVQTFTAQQGFNDSDFLLNGATSGNLVLRAAAVAGSSSIRFPAGSIDFTATGGASQVVRQSSAGGALSVGQLAASDLSNGVTGSGAVALAASPALTGTPTTPTAANGTNTTQVASTAFVQSAVASGTSGVASINGLTGILTGIDTNTLNAVSANHPVVAGDIGTTLYVTGGPFTITWPASFSTFASNFVVNVCNGNSNTNTSHAVLLSNFPSPAKPRLWPGQCMTAAIENGVGAITVMPPKWQPGFANPKLFVDTGGADTNDGLISNAAGNALRNAQTCWTIFQTEWDLNTVQPVCAPTGGQTQTGGISCSAGGTGRVYFLVGQGGSRATIQNTAGNVPVQTNDFCGYIIADNINFDCTAAASHPCTGFFNHQQNGVDFSTTGFTSGNTFTGANSGDIGYYSDSIGKLNTAAPLTLAGTLGQGITLNLGTMADINNGIATAAGTSISSNLIQVLTGSQLTYAGGLAAGATTTIGQVLDVQGNGSQACVTTFSVTGSPTISIRQWAVLNNGAFFNQSATAIPGSAGLSTAGSGYTAGIVTATSAAGC